MFCPACGKEVLSSDEFCPYCGGLMNADKPTEEKVEAEEETAAAAAEAEEAAEEVEEEAADEAAKEEAESEITEEEAAAAVAVAATTEKKSGVAVKVLAVLAVIAAVVVAMLAVIAAVVVAFFLGGKLLGSGGAGEATTVADTTADITEDVTDATGEVTEVANPGAIPFEDEIPEDYAMVYPDGFDYKNTDVSEYITLGEYKGQTVEVTLPDTMSDEEFENQLNYFLMQYAELGDAVTGRPAAINDTVLIDYAGTVDGVAFEGGTAADQTATLGMGQYIPGFEEGIVGMSIGETRDVTVTFPENYGLDTLNGKEAVFKITLKSITENILPDYTDDFVMENFGIATVAEFEEELRAMNAEEVMSERYSAILEIITETAEMKKYPDGVVEDYIYQQVSADRYTAEYYYGMTVEEYISGYYGMTVPQYEANVLAMAENMIKQEFALYAVAAAEGITVTDEDMAVETANCLEYYGATDIESLCATLGVSEKFLENSIIRFSVIYNKVMELMMENTTFIVVE